MTLSHVTTEPVHLLDVPNRCFWRVSQPPQSLVCPCPSSFETHCWNQILNKHMLKKKKKCSYSFKIGVVFQSGGDWQTYFIIHIHKMFFLIIIIKLAVFALLTPSTDQESSALWSCVIFWFAKLCIPENRSPDIRNSHFPPSLCSSLFLSCWSGPLLPCRSRIKFAAASSSFFFLLFWSWKLTKDSKALRASFLPLMIDFTSQLLPRHTHTHPHTHPHTHTHTHKLIHTLSCQQSP